MPQIEFKFGDRVVHSLRPEWGTGVVTQAQSTIIDGKPAQRLTLRFDRAGLKTLSSPPAELEHADTATTPSGSPPVAAADDGWLVQLESGTLNERMAALPEATRDPFETLATRIKATLALWRFSDQGGTLLDWAAMQTGLKDPLTRFNRHELEQYFRRFASEREAHLKRLLLEAKKQPSPEIERAKAEAPQAAKDAMRKMHF